HCITSILKQKRLQTSTIFIEFVDSLNRAVPYTARFFHMDPLNLHEHPPSAPILPKKPVLLRKNANINILMPLKTSILLLFL
ncbi:hypothetical protein, partial [Cytobacillus oceanisediminis]|uniref:hypothetical protein n=1 Tax=Cytobacillus oceanisediminis TaxID=665099 RepID=UPI001C211423